MRSRLVDDPVWRDAPRQPFLATRARGNAALGAVLACTALVAMLVAAAVVLKRAARVDSQPARPSAGAAPKAAPTTSASASGGGLAAILAKEQAAVDARVKAVLREAEALDRTVWAKEVQAQRYEEFFIGLWDSFRAAKDKLAVLEKASFESLALPSPGGKTDHDWGITLTRFDGQESSVDPAGWRALLSTWREAGYRPTELEFHQSEFVYDPPRAARSTVATVLHVVNERANTRHVIRCKLKVEWQPERAGGTFGVNLPRAIEVTDLTVAGRTGAVAFEPVTLPGGSEAGLATAAASKFVIAYDLDGDGRSEILVPWENLLLRNRGGWRFEREALFPDGRKEVSAAVVGDFDGDALPDMVCAIDGKVCLARGAPGGTFAAGPPKPVAELSFEARTVSALTAGDVDGDGDLDAWLGQYKPPYDDGQMPTPYYDANDGHPAALIVNDGTGRFTDRTEAAGLAGKRHRRTFAGSLVDLDVDGDLDLLVNSDFAGLDIYYNDGAGGFADVTEQVIDERHNFGMGHAFADFNSDAALDMYTIGMSSTTARRLTAMGAGRPEFPDHQKKRPQMGYGNRMFLATAPSALPEPRGTVAVANGRRRKRPAPFVQHPRRDEVARTGWSWGVTAPDFDNDGDPDVFVGNGMVSGPTCRDYCTTYWRRDIYMGSSKEDPVMKNVFAQHGMTPELSWNGYEHDVLFMNEAGRGFLNISHLMGVGFEFDTRNVISDDLDGDGRMDLLVVERRWADQRKYVHVLRNNWPTKHNWVGVTLRETGQGVSPIGAEIRVRTAGGTQVSRIVTGDSFQSQHANARHFGLGGQEAIEAIEVTWPDGKVTRVVKPPINAWHAVAADPAENSVTRDD